jgi:ABC-type lipoprotein release transport system permease subunit
LLAAGSGIVNIEEPRIASPEAFADFQQRTAQLVISQVGADLKSVTAYTRAGSFQINTLNGSSSPGDANLTAAYYPDLLTHVKLVEGAWPGGTGLQTPIPAALSQSAAAQTGLKVGDIACVGTQNTPKDRSWCIRLVGTWQPAKPADPYWRSGPGNAYITLVAADYFQFLASANRNASDVSFRAGRVYEADPARFTLSGAPALVAGIRHLRGQVVIQSGGSFLTTLDNTIQAYLDRTRVNQFPSRLVGASLVLVVAYALALLSHNYLDAHLRQALLWRTRGGARDRVRAALLLQIGILLLPAIFVAICLSYAVAWFVLSGETGSSAPLNFSAGNLAGAVVLGTAIAAAVVAALIFRFSRRSVLELRRATARTSSVGWWRWRNFDLWLALLAIPLLAEVQLRSQVAVRSASSGADLVGLALPVAALAGLGLAALRLLPSFARVCDLAPRKLAARLAWTRMSRQPTEHSGLALLLALAVAVGAFAGVYSATERQNIVDRAAYKVGADLVVRYDDRALPDSMANDLATLEHVTSYTSVLRNQVQVATGSLSVTALGVEPRTFLATAWTRDGLSTPPLGQAFGRLANRDTHGIPVLMSTVTMSRLGIRPGADIYFFSTRSGPRTSSSTDRPFQVTVVGAVNYVPTLYPGTDEFMVMSLERLRAVSDDARPNELWLNVKGDHRELVAHLLRDPNVSYVQDRATAQAEGLNDPLFLTLQANLAIGFITALALAALAFAVHFLVAARRRLAEHAILEANGLEPGVVRTGMAIEQGIVVLFALVVGCALAITLIVWLLPSLELGSGPSDVIPPTLLSADWPVLGISALMTLVVAGALAWAIRRAGTSVDIMQELRRLG